MPVDYTTYHPEWLSHIRPAILERAGHKCEFCGVENYMLIIRGWWHGWPAYQTEDGQIWDAQTSEMLGEDYIGTLQGDNKLTRVVLTVAHLDHNKENNNPDNLAALCQKHHLGHDQDKNIRIRMENRRRMNGQLIFTF